MNEAVKKEICEKQIQQIWHKLTKGMPKNYTH